MRVVWCVILHFVKACGLVDIESKVVLDLIGIDSPDLALKFILYG